MMNENYFYAEIIGEIPNTISRIVIGRFNVTVSPGKIYIGNVQIDTSTIMGIHAIDRESVEYLYSTLEQTLESCDNPIDKSCMKKLKETVKKLLDLPKEPTYVIFSDSKLFGKTIDIIFIQGLDEK